MKNKLAFAAIFLLALLLFFANTDQLATNAQSPNFEIFVAENQSQCQRRSQCFYNDAPDTIEATALQKAVNFARENNLEGANIHILAPYEIKTQMVIVDFPVNLIGENGGWLSTSSSNCSQPMLKITSGVTVKNLYISDGSCFSPSRDLLHIDSATDVLIDHSTLDSGANAIVYKDNAGSLEVRSSEIRNNSVSAVFSENNEPSARLNLVANNIFENGSAVQVYCTIPGNVDHNYWGEEILPSSTAPDCGADDRKILGARILPEQVGVAAKLLTLTEGYPSNDFYGFRAKSSQHSRIYVVNHASKIPFFDRMLDRMSVCGNYFDIFLDEGSSPSSMTLAFSYDSTDKCKQAIQSISLCGSGDSRKYPLMWLDVKTSVTKGWDNAGDNPKSDAGNIFSGQEVRCDTANKRIEIVVDNDGRPDLANDMHFTPFVVGFEIATIDIFKAAEDTEGIVNISWATGSEVNTSVFRVMRSLSQEGPYNQVGLNIPATGKEFETEYYNLEDKTVAPATVYYYKLEVLNTRGEIQAEYGPLKIQTKAQTVNTNTPTAIATKTPTPTKTNTPTATKTTASSGRPTSTRIPTRTQTPFITATNSFRTVHPPYATRETTAAPEALETPTPTQNEFVKPNNPESTKTIRPTIDSGWMLEKQDRSGRSRVFLFLGIGLAAGVAAITIFVYSRRKKP